MSAEELEGIADRLDDINEQLAELAMAALRDAIEAGEGKPELERRITRARRAVEKASTLLRDQRGDDGF
ncbi:MAG: hypothetical protein AAFZ07_20725 [Actinomycetota bacterium]